MQLSNSVAGPSNSGVTRYVVQTSDALSDLRVTVSLEGNPDKVIWYKERYLSTASTPEIIENLVHQPSNTICWSVHRPTNIRKQGWYVRMRSPVFPPGVFIPFQPVSSTSPYYEEGSLSFKCRTTDMTAMDMGRGSLSSTPSTSEKGRPPFRSATREDRDSMSSVASTSSSVHSYPPTPTASPPPRSSQLLSPLRIPSSLSKISSLPSSSSAAFPPGSRSANGNGKRRQEPDDLQTDLQPGSSTRRGRRAPPPPALPFSHITEFILSPLASSTSATASATTSTPTAASASSNAPSSIFSKALSLLKSAAPSNFVDMNGNSFSLTRIPVAPLRIDQFAATLTPTGTSPGPPPPYTSTVNLNADSGMLSPALASLTSLSSSNFVSPLPPPLLTFTDHTSLFTFPLYAALSATATVNGVIEIDRSQERMLGVDTAFWVIVALEFWAYMEEKEGYLAAADD